MPTVACRDCGHQVSPSAFTCPECNAPNPSKPIEEAGYGFEWKSKQTLLGLPLIHVSFKYRLNRMPVVAKGWLAIGQFSYGFVNLSQFGVGPVCISQFAIAGVAVAQFCAAVLGVCQVGAIYEGVGMVVWRLKDLL